MEVASALTVEWDRDICPAISRNVRWVASTGSRRSSAAVSAEAPRTALNNADWAVGREWALVRPRWPGCRQDLLPARPEATRTGLEEQWKAPGAGSGGLAAFRPAPRPRPSGSGRAAAGSAG